LRAIRDVEDYLLECALLFRRLTLQLVEVIHAVHDAKHRLLDLPCAVAAIHGKLVEAERRLSGACRAQRPRRRAERRVIAALDEFPLEAQADEKHALGGRVRNPSEE